VARATTRGLYLTSPPYPVVCLLSSYYGIDINPATKKFERPGVRIIIGDQSNASFWREFKQQYPVADIFIDDGVSESVGLELSLYGMRDVPGYTRAPTTSSHTPGRRHTLIVAFTGALHGATEGHAHGDVLARARRVGGGPAWCCGSHRRKCKDRGR
jgi:hypothetical protein